MTSTKSIEKMPLKSNSYNNPKKSSIINPETNALKQDILFFKNDIFEFNFSNRILY